ncbi:MAG: hypothetical protein E7279_01445 [Lachnospiraceae bacterium]|nr:hypothetical protein [Lachnospiraceae bacterium]
MYDYEKFKKIVKEELYNILHDFDVDAIIKYKSDNYNNAYNLYIINQKSDNLIIPAIDIKPIYEKYAKGDFTINDIISSLSKNYLKRIENNKVYSLSGFLDKKNVLNNVRACAINYDNFVNYIESKDIAYSLLEDGNVAFIYKYVIGAECGIEFCDNLNTITLDNNRLDLLGITLEELNLYAFENLKDKYVINSTDDIFEDILFKGEICTRFGINTISTNEDLYGASLIFIQDIMDDLCKHYNTNELGIIPMSVHEFTVFDWSEHRFSVIELNDVLHAINVFSENKDNVFMDNVLRYDKKLSSLNMCKSESICKELYDYKKTFQRHEKEIKLLTM